MVRDYLDGGLNKTRIAPLWLARSGSVYYSLNSAGSSGSYWSSTVGGRSGAYHLIFYSNNVRPAYGGFRGYGYSVRCVAQ